MNKVLFILITKDIIQTMDTHTNPEIKLESEKNKNKKATQKPTDKSEIRAVIVIIVLSATMKSNNLSVREKFDVTFCGNCYRSFMSCEKFDSLINYLRYDDKHNRLDRRKHDAFAAFRNVPDLSIIQCRVSEVDLCHLEKKSVAVIET